MTVRQMVDKFAEELAEFRSVNLSLVVGEDRFIDAFNQCVASFGIKFCSEDAKDYFIDDVREALGHKRALTNVFWMVR